MRYRKLDANGDFSFGQGGLNFYKDQAELVAQAIKTRLLFFTGEWFLDTDDGTPWLDEVLGKYTESRRALTISDRILGTFGVTEIVSMTPAIDPVSRRYSLSVTVNTIYGQVYLESLKLGV